MIATILNTMFLQAAAPTSENPAGVFEDMGHMMIYGALIALTCAVGVAWMMIKLQKRREGVDQLTSINPSKR